MTTGIVFHLEDSRYVGVWPSHLDELRITARALGVDRFRAIDLTMDGWHRGMGDDSVDYQRHTTLAEWAAARGDTMPVIALETPATLAAAGVTGIPLPLFAHPPDAWYVIGPSSGLDPNDPALTGAEWVYFPTIGGVGLHSMHAAVLTIAHRYLQTLGG